MNHKVKDKVNQNITSVVYSDNKLKNKKVIAIGDSLTQGDYGSEPEGTPNLHDENYPYFLAKYFRCTVINKGSCGYDSMRYWKEKAKLIDFTDAEVIVIMLGTNGGLSDTLIVDTTIVEGQTYEDYADTQTGDYCKIIEYCLAQTSGLARIFLASPPTASTRRRTFAEMEAVYNIVVQIAEKYSLPIINVMYESGLSDATRLMYQPIDGMHCGLLGYQTIAKYIGSEICAKL